MQDIHSNKSGLINSSEEISFEQKETKIRRKGVWFNTEIVFRIYSDFMDVFQGWYWIYRTLMEYGYMLISCEIDI